MEGGSKDPKLSSSQDTESGGVVPSMDSCIRGPVWDWRPDPRGMAPQIIFCKWWKLIYASLYYSLKNWHSTDYVQSVYEYKKERESAVRQYFQTHFSDEYGWHCKSAENKCGKSDNCQFHVPDAKITDAVTPKTYEAKGAKEVNIGMMDKTDKDIKDDEEEWDVVEMSSCVESALNGVKTKKSWFKSWM